MQQQVSVDGQYEKSPHWLGEGLGGGGVGVGGDGGGGGGGGTVGEG